MKARGLTRLRWYCQICQKACRDATGYKLHTESESHMRQLQAVAGDSGQRAGKVIHDFSSQFQRQFVALLSRRCVFATDRAQLADATGLAPAGCSPTRCTTSTSRIATTCT